MKFESDYLVFPVTNHTLQKISIEFEVQMQNSTHWSLHRPTTLRIKVPYWHENIFRASDISWHESHTIKCLD